MEAVAIDDSLNHPSIVFFQCRETRYTIAVDRATGIAFGAATVAFDATRSGAVWDAVMEYQRALEAQRCPMGIASVCRRAGNGNGSQ